jgi:hypothetical protein
MGAADHFTGPENAQATVLSLRSFHDTLIFSALLYRRTHCLLIDRKYHPQPSLSKTEIINSAAPATKIPMIHAQIASHPLDTLQIIVQHEQ